MNSRAILELYGLNHRELLNLVISLMPELSLEDLDLLLIQVEMEIQYREDNNLLDEDNEE